MPEEQSPAGEKRRSGFARFAWAVLCCNLVVILSGAYVRATRSGEGCGNTWPLCNGQMTPNTNIHTIIEYTHRAMTGLDLPLVALLAFLAFRFFPRGHAVRRMSLLSGLFLVTEAPLGALLVKYSGPALLSIHLVNTLTLLACLTLTAWWSTEKPRGGFGMAAWCSLGAVVALAITGAIAALGDTLYPAAGVAQDFDPASSPLLHLRALHPLLAAGVAAWLTMFAVRRLRSAKAPALGVIVVVWLQLLAGMVNLALRAPVGMQLVHLLIADLLWISLVILCAEA